MTLAKNSDVLVAITPGGPETKAIVNAAVLDALGPQGYLVHVARGSVVDQPVLLKYLQESSPPSPAGRSALRAYGCGRSESPSGRWNVAVS